MGSCSSINSVKVQTAADAIRWADSHPKDAADWQQVRIQAAIAAMQGVIASRTMIETIEEAIKIGTLHGEEVSFYSAMLKMSVGFADALVNELKGE